MANFRIFYDIIFSSIVLNTKAGADEETYRSLGEFLTTHNIKKIIKVKGEKHEIRET